jgi:hypothetical protein
MMPPLVAYWSAPELAETRRRVSDILLAVELREAGDLVAVLWLHVPSEYGEVAGTRLFSFPEEGRLGGVEGAKRGARAAASGGRSRGMGDGPTTPGDTGAAGSTQLPIPNSAYVYSRGADPRDSGEVASDPVGRGGPDRVDKVRSQGS